MEISTYISIIVLNINGLNAPIKTQGGKLDEKIRPIYVLLIRDSLQTKDTQRLKVRGWKKIFHANGKNKKAWVAMLISDKTGSKTKAIKKDKEGHCIMIKGSVQEEDITLVNIHVPSIGAPKYIKQILTDIDGEIGGNT